MSKRNHIVERASDVNGGQYIQTNPSYNSGYEDGKKAGKEYCASEITTLREQVEKLTKELSVLKTTPPHLRQDLHCVASDLSAQVRERDEQLTAALAACEKKDEALNADNSKLWPSKLREEAISIQPDASALNEYRNQVIEECATCCEEHQGSAQTCANAIRGLKK